MEPFPAELADMEEFICATPDLVAPRIRHAMLARLLADWAAQSDGGRRLPARGDFSPERLRYILGNLILWDVSPEPLTATYRLYGSNFAFARGGDMTGKRLDEIPDPVMRRLALHGLRRVMAMRQPLLTRGRYRLRDGSALASEALTLPLAGDGSRIDMIMHGMFNQMLGPADGISRMPAGVEVACDAPAALAERIADLRLLRLLRDWDSWRQGRPLPPRASFAPETLSYLLGHLFLFDILAPEGAEAGPRFRYRLFGSAIARLRGFDLTGRCIDEHPDGAFGARAHLAYLQAVAARQPLWAKVDAVGEQGMVSRFEGLILPLASDGETPDMVLSAQIMAAAD
ncbi:MAG TPA: PAS domain-containing protein [Ferrovibrio sp.]|uniref:PAS domain-containing protein n=1 Tax=Ferrovibrio sp. TaxID=1917215 RepID=UPI002ED0E9C9